MKIKQVEELVGITRKNIRECAIYANCTAAVSVQYVGATGGVQDKAIVDEMLAKYRKDYQM